MIQGFRLRESSGVGETELSGLFFLGTFDLFGVTPVTIVSGDTATSATVMGSGFAEFVVRTTATAGGANLFLRVQELDPEMPFSAPLNIVTLGSFAGGNKTFTWGRRSATARADIQALFQLMFDNTSLVDTNVTCALWASAL